METDEFTFGVEEEYQLVDPHTLSLRSRAEEVLEVDWSGEVEPELQETMLEVATPVCRSGTEIVEQLRRLRMQAGATAAAEELEIVAAGLHPFSSWHEHRLTDGDRPRMLEARFGHIIRDEHFFGMHIHVAVPHPHDRVDLLNRVASYSPHLLALSASSPLFEGRDTDYSSFRTILFGRFPFTGAPPRFRSSDEYEDFVGFLLRTNAIPDRRTLYWSVRLNPSFPTLEFRACDVCPRLDDAAALAVLARALVIMAAGREASEPSSMFSWELDHTLRKHNEWCAARWGLDADIADPMTSSGNRPIRDAIRQLLDDLRPIIERTGDAWALEHIEQLLKRGNGAARIRERLQQGADFKEVVGWLIEETRLGTGLDRRQTQRGEP